MNMVKDILKELKSKSNREKEEIYRRFFKTKQGEYGYGDTFWGLTVPDIRKIAKKYSNAPFTDVKFLVNHTVHEVRVTGYLILTYRYEKADIKEKEEIVDFYLSNLDGVNNWDIVDLSSYKILGDYLQTNKERKAVLYQLANSNDLWKQRISIVSTLSFIKKGEFEDTFKISKMLLNHEHDLIHKAVGWMLREVGKKDIQSLRDFLEENIKSMPRTTIRYAIEKMGNEERKRYMSM
jgi:3-methyladenine DNA glycosylase AlkD